MKSVIKSLLLLLLTLNRTGFAEVVLRFQNHIDSDASHLGELLQITPENPDWSNLPLDSHPSAGEWITRDRLLDWMQEKTGPFSLSWQGKTRIQVASPANSSTQDLIDKARQKLAHKLKAEYVSFKLKALSTPKAGKYVPHRYQVNVSISSPVAKRVCVWLQQGEENIPVWFQVQAFAHVQVANKTLQANKPVNEKDFSLETRDIAGLKHPPVKQLPENFSLKVPMETGDILQDNQLKEAAQVVHGETIKVSIQQHHIRVVMEAVALSDGYTGKTIQVRNPQNQRRFMAVVTGTGQAEVSS